MHARGRLLELPADSHRDGDYHQQHTQLDVDFLGVEEVDRTVLQVWVGENPVDVEERRRAVGGEVERLPGFSAKLAAEVRRDHYERERVQGQRAEHVDPRLLGRVDRVEDVQQGELCGR